MVGNFDYIFNRSKKATVDANIAGGDIHDDTDVDMVKVMRRLQIDEERDEMFQ